MHQHHDIDSRSGAIARCPACGRPAEAGTGGWSACACGRTWPVRVPDAARDDLGRAAPTVDRLRSHPHGPVTPAERAAARRRLDNLAEQRRSGR